MAGGQSAESHIDTDAADKHALINTSQFDALKRGDASELDLTQSIFDWRSRPSTRPNQSCEKCRCGSDGKRKHFHGWLGPDGMAKRLFRTRYCRSIRIGIGAPANGAVNVPGNCALI